MTSKQLKKHLLDNPTLIIDILEGLNCHHIKHVQNKRVTAGLPDGDNESSIQVLLLDDNLNTIVHTRHDYEGGDIFSFVSYLKKCTFRNSLMFVCRLLNIEYSIDYVKPTNNKTYSFLRKFNRNSSYKEVEENKVLDENVLNGYIKAPHQIFVDDYLTVDSQIKFGIHYDLHDHRILIPIRDLEGRLITIKGRTVHENYKQDGIMKYIAYYEYFARCLLFGYYENYWDLLISDEVILVESEKAVIQADGYGVNNILALSKNKISEEQLFKIISLNKDVVLALDKNVELDELKAIAEEFRGLCKVFAILDHGNYLGDKDSPFDKGKEVWEDLYKNKIQIL